LITLIIIGALIWPHSGQFYKVKFQNANILQIHPEAITVRYLAYNNKTDSHKLYNSFIEVNQNTIEQYNKGDTIRIYHLINRPGEAFLNKKFPPQSKLIAQYGFFILMIWLAFVVNKVKRVVFSTLKNQFHNNNISKN